MIELIEQAAAQNNTHLTRQAAEQLAQYAQLVLQRNQSMNLTAITAPAEVAVKHFADSLAGLAFLPVGAKCVDIGSGAGFPAIPLKVARPDLQFVLLDSLNKRIGFLNEVILQLGLAGITAVHSRAEDYARVARATFDIAVARAVAPLAVLVEYALPLLKKGGALIAYKGEGAVAEVAAATNALATLGGSCERIHTFRLSGEYDRSIIVIRKTAETPMCYPRAGDKPRRQTL